jgi:hypothetical protein
MDIRRRTTRTLRVTELKLSPEERSALAQLYSDPRYESLLNVMERGCIELETAHFNTSTGNPEEILGGHAVTKAAWLFFAYVQKQVYNAYNAQEVEASQAEELSPSLEDMLQDFHGIPGG